MTPPLAINSLDIGYVEAIVNKLTLHPFQQRSHIVSSPSFDESEKFSPMEDSKRSKQFWMKKHNECADLAAVFRVSDGPIDKQRHSIFTQIMSNSAVVRANWSKLYAYQCALNLID